VRGIDNPAFCKKGSDHPSAKVFPLDRSARQVSMLDPKTMKYSFIDTCFASAFGTTAEARRRMASTDRDAIDPTRTSVARATANKVVKSFRYLLTDPRQFDILHFGPAAQGTE
jgi:hypothetical protein